MKTAWRIISRPRRSINAGRFDVLSVQHEFGLFGGENCDYLPTFLEAVNIPSRHHLSYHFAQTVSGDAPESARGGRAVPVRSW